VPGIFAFVTQSFGFVLGVLPLAAAVWLADPDRWWRWIGFVVTIMIALAGLLSGTRSSWIWLPIQLILIFTLVGRNRSAVALTSVIAVLTLLVLLGSSFPTIWDSISALSWFYLVDTTGHEVAAVIQGGNVLLAHGTGTHTGAIRYILPQGATFGVGIEGWYAKVLYELGAIGLVAVLGTWFLIVVKMWRARTHVLSQPGRAYASALLVIVLTTVVNLVKGAYIDLDPLNVYFWFFVGLAIALPRLAGSAQALDVDAGVATEASGRSGASPHEPPATQGPCGPGHKSRPGVPAELT
jgi:O-antigen ligase